MIIAVEAHHEAFAVLVRKGQGKLKLAVDEILERVASRFRRIASGRGGGKDLPSRAIEGLHAVHGLEEGGIVRIVTQGLGHGLLFFRSRFGLRLFRGLLMPAPALLFLFVSEGNDVLQIHLVGEGETFASARLPVGSALHGVAAFLFRLHAVHGAQEKFRVPGLFLGHGLSGLSGPAHEGLGLAAGRTFGREVLPALKPPEGIVGKAFISHVRTPKKKPQGLAAAS